MQENREDVVFGTSVVGGFRRKNVLDYIEKLQNLLSQSFADAGEKQTLLQQAQAELGKMRKELDALQQTLEEAQAENRALQTKLEAACLEARQARAEAAELRAGRTLRRGKK